MILELLLVIVVFGGLYQYMQANGCGNYCQRQLANGARAGDRCPCACATCPCSPLEGIFEAIQSIPDTIYQNYNQVYEWFLTRPVAMSTFEIVPSISDSKEPRRRASSPDIGRSSTSRPAAEVGNNGGSQLLNDEQAAKIAALCNKCKAKGVTCMRTCPNAKR